MALRAAGNGITNADYLQTARACHTGVTHLHAWLIQGLDLLLCKAEGSLSCPVPCGWLVQMRAWP